MNVTPTAPALSRKKLAATLLLGAVAGGASVFVVQSVGAVLGSPEAAVLPAEEPQIASLERELPPVDDITPMAASDVTLSAREREVLKRLASLPDLPVVQAPAFDIKVQAAPSAASVATAKADHAATTNLAPAQPVGESVIARIQVLSVEKGRVFYRSVDENIHTARAGERLLGVNGRVLKVDEHGAELQIDGHRMRVAANNM